MVLISPMIGFNISRLCFNVFFSPLSFPVSQSVLPSIYQRQRPAALFWEKKMGWIVLHFQEDRKKSQNIKLPKNTREKRRSDMRRREKPWELNEKAAELRYYKQTVLQCKTESNSRIKNRVGAQKGLINKSILGESSTLRLSMQNTDLVYTCMYAHTWNCHLLLLLTLEANLFSPNLQHNVCHLALVYVSHFRSV